jgi:hypothetical protein
MIKVSAETKEMLVWLYNKFGIKAFAYESVSDTIPVQLFEKFKTNKFIIMSDTHELEDPDSTDNPVLWVLTKTCIDRLVKRKL